MAEHSDPKTKVLFAITLATEPHRVRVALTTADGSATLEIRQKGKRVGLFPVPGDVSAFDLPFWSLSVLRSTIQGLSDDDLCGVEQSIQKQVPNKGGVFTVCVGPKIEFHRCQLFHFDRKDVTYARRRNVVTITAPDRGRRFSVDTWTMIFHTRTESSAKELVGEIEKSNEALLSLDGCIVSITAYNADQWKVAGLPAEQIIKYASRRNISLKRIETAGPGLSFRTTSSE